MKPTVEEIQAALTRLSQRDLARFREWYHEFETEVWEEHIQDEMAERKLDQLADHAIQDFLAGRCHERLKHVISPDFWVYYDQLPAEVRALADKRFDLIKKEQDVTSSLHLKKIGRYRFVRIEQHYRALAVETEQCLIWFWIGQYAEDV